MTANEQVKALQNIANWIAAGGQAGIFFDFTRSDEAVITLHLKSNLKGNSTPISDQK